MALSDDYIAALERLAALFATYRGQSGTDAVLVGGAAVAILTAGLFPSGDFDVVAARDDDFGRAILQHGFRHEDRPGQLKIGYYHQEHSCFGFQQVSGTLFAMVRPTASDCCGSCFLATEESSCHQSRT